LTAIKPKTNSSLTGKLPLIVEDVKPNTNTDWLVVPAPRGEAVNNSRVDQLVSINEESKSEDHIE